MIVFFALVLVVGFTGGFVACALMVMAGERPELAEALARAEHAEARLAEVHRG